MGQKNIEEVCADALIDMGLKIAVAESCTGGLLSCRLTNIPGSSAYFERGFITYTNLSKTQMLGVPEDVIDEDGAVSYQTAVEMAKGVLNNSTADIALAVTGIAGPSGGTEQKPVGTVFIAFVSKDEVNCQRFHFTGNRLEIKEQTCNAALELLKEHIM